MSPLFENAVASIELGVEDFGSKDPRRAASAIRNFFAGVLLLLKEKLRQESPGGSNDALLYERVEFRRENGTIVFVGKGTKTVDVQQISERFKSLGLALDLARLNDLQRIRNDVEHHSTKQAPAQLQQAVARTFVLVARVLEEHLGRKPHETFADGIWATMLSEAETFREAEERCRRSITQLTNRPPSVEPALSRLRCPECSSALVEAMKPGDYFDARFVCRACGVECGLEETICAALALVYDLESADPQAGDEELGHCPACAAAAFYLPADLCLVCGESRPYTQCARCEEPLDLDEQESGLCGYCEHMAE